jgi:hypothetical protein
MIEKYLLLTCLVVGVFVVNVNADVCRYWLGEVDTETDVSYEIDESKPKNVMKGIECLLKLQGRRQEGLFSGATTDNVSQIFPPSSIEVCALYYVSYLFYGDWKHANAVALVGEDGSINSNESVKIAYESYRRWHKTLKKVGLQKARDMKLDPLSGSGVRWY